jgi:hypothetical protein
VGSVSFVVPVWVVSLQERFDRAFDLLESAIRDCTDELWLSNMWEVLDDDPAREIRGPGAVVLADRAERRALVQRFGTPWGVAWHALERLDFLLTGGFVPWEVWPPLAVRLAAGTAAVLPAPLGSTGHTGLDILTMSTPWSRADLLAYLGYCRQRAADTLHEVTDEKASTRRGRRTYAGRLMQAYDHVVEHAAQIRQFITSAASPIAELH